MANKLLLATSPTAPRQRSSGRCTRQRRGNSEKEELMMSMQPAESPEESPTEPQTTAQSPPVHVRRKWIPIS